MQIKTIESYDGLYQISDNGLVISCPRYLTDISGRIRFTKGGTLTPKTHPDGYYFVSLSKDGIAANKYTCRMY